MCENCIGWDREISACMLHNTVPGGCPDYQKATTNTICGGSGMGNEEKVTEKINEEILNIANELLQDAKASAQRAHKALITVAWLWFASVIAIVAGFLIYLYQYDFTSTVEQTGVYTLMDSEGNIISSDLLPEDIITIEEILKNGKNESN